MENEGAGSERDSGQQGLTSEEEDLLQQSNKKVKVRLGEEARESEMDEAEMSDDDVEDVDFLDSEEYPVIRLIKEEKFCLKCRGGTC
ncbi:hypothetical protein O6P43_013063 [Quillaja saponaria]|uniref:Uncharacterized protein n=1 Tax=Quillaja saponaria TaxID=32244 RepID=A0AAD7M3D9_QUISA|nr:hypothetical protein O6P43_013063 [Quillaja saponaria]